MHAVSTLLRLDAPAAAAVAAKAAKFSTGRLTERLDQNLEHPGQFEPVLPGDQKAGFASNKIDDPRDRAGQRTGDAGACTLSPDIAER